MCVQCVYIERQYEDPEFGAHTPTYPHAHAHAHAHKNWASRSRFEEAVGGVQEVECEEQRVGYGSYYKGRLRSTIPKPYTAKPEIPNL